MGLLNVNVGVLGHVDSGKTSLAKAMSTVASTASFDKNPQSKERGITLDLGFSSFHIPTPSSLEDATSEPEVQVTLVDCPGHASLIKTIIGGAQIIDLMMLVVDVTKGIQTQTAECIVIGEITCNHLIIALNKIDLLPQDKRTEKIEKMSAKLLKTFQRTKFKSPPIIPVSANPDCPMNIDTLMSALGENLRLGTRDSQGPFLFSVDHCFPIKGQGTVMTGTVLSGSVNVGDEIEVASLAVTKKVKSMQMFKKPIQKAVQGDRLGICVTQFDASLLERGVLCTPGSLPSVKVAVCVMKRIPFYRGSVSVKDKFHVTVGHLTVSATLLAMCNPPAEGEELDLAAEALYVETWDEKAEYMTCVLEFQKEISVQKDALAITSRLDTDIHANACRLVCSGPLSYTAPEKASKAFLEHLCIYKTKIREGVVDRMQDVRTVICDGMFKRETSMDVFNGLTVVLSTGEVGAIAGSFGKSGKFKVVITSDGRSAQTSTTSTSKRIATEDGMKDDDAVEGTEAGVEDTFVLLPSTVERLAASKKGKKGKGGDKPQLQKKEGGEGSSSNTTSAATGKPLAQPRQRQQLGKIKVALTFKKYIFDPSHKLVQ